MSVLVPPCTYFLRSRRLLLNLSKDFLSFKTDLTCYGSQEAVQALGTLIRLAERFMAKGQLLGPITITVSYQPTYHYTLTVSWYLHCTKRTKPPPLMTVTVCLGSTKCLTLFQLFRSRKVPKQVISLYSGIKKCQALCRYMRKFSFFQDFFDRNSLNKV